MHINNEHRKIVEKRKYKYLGTYKAKEITIDKKNKKGINVYIRVRCPYCGAEYDVQLSRFKRGQNCGKCCQKYENSFAYFIQVELNESLNKYWDWEKNTVNPYCITKCSNKKVWIKCTKTDYHKSYEISCDSFYSGRRCPYCVGKKVHPKDSFAQYLADVYGDDALEKYWSSKNIIDPFTIAPKSHKKVWIKCQNTDYHEDYLVSCDRFYSGDRCPYCSNRNRKIHRFDSFGALYPEKIMYWSKRNKKSPYEVTPQAHSKYWFYCEDCGSEFETTLHCLIGGNRSMKCRNCTSSKGEQKVTKWLISNKIKFIQQKEFRGLVGINNGNLSYDFYLPNNNLLIEYQGEFHDGTGEYYEGHFEKQQEHDKRKREYAKNHNIDLLEIWYYDYDNVEQILRQTLKN